MGKPYDKSWKWYGSSATYDFLVFLLDGDVELASGGQGRISSALMVSTDSIMLAL